MRSLFLFLVFLSLLGCIKGEDIEPKSSYEQMTLIYIAANNDLRGDALNSITQIRQGFKEKKRERLLVYIKTSADKSYLIEIKPYNMKGLSDTLKIYHNENSADPLFIKQVIADARQHAPAHSYGLVLWSHATSWTPPNHTIKIKSFGLDDHQEVDIRALKTCLPKDFEYIIFDACSMASVEVYYELRNNAKYIMASPAEVLSTGVPYDQVIDDLFGGVQGLKSMGQKFIDFYAKQPGRYASATISLIETADLQPVAEATKKLLYSYDISYPYQKDLIQNLTFDKNAWMKSYDFLSFLKANYPPNVYSTLKDAIEKVVLYKGHTPSFLGVPILESCGLTVYLPEVNDMFKDYYSTLDWTGASNWSVLF